MKDKKKRSRSKTSAQQNKLSEPFIPYGIVFNDYLSMLAGMSVRDIEHAGFTGKILTDVQKQTDLGPQTIAEVMGVSKSKYYDLLKEDDLDPRNIDALADFAALWKTGIEAFDGDTALLNEWLHIRNENLGNIKPIELLSSRMGRRQLEKAFFRIEHSLYG